MTIEKNIMVVCACLMIVGGLAGYLYYRYRYCPFRAKLRMERLRREEREGVAPSPNDYQYAIAFDADGLTVTHLRSPNREAVAMQWREVNRATAFKRDLFAVDCICLFLHRVDDTGIEVDEEMAGWSGFVEALPQHLPGCKAWSEWFNDVAFPAFATNATEIYGRATQGNASPASGKDMG